MINKNVLGERQAGGSVISLPPGAKQDLVIDMRPNTLGDNPAIIAKYKSKIKDATGNIFENIKIITGKGPTERLWP